jgi:hypothetical protein
MSTVTTTRTDAEQYNTRIAQALRTAEAVASYIDGYQNATPDVDDPIADAIAGTDISRYGLVTALAEFGDLDDASSYDALAPWFVDVLAVEATGKFRNGEWTVTGVEVTLTIGGPNTWIEYCGHGESVTVRTAWGYDRASEVVWAPVLADLLDGWMTELEHEFSHSR